MISYGPRSVASFIRKLKVLDEIVLRECSFHNLLLRVWGEVGDRNVVSLSSGKTNEAPSPPFKPILRKMQDAFYFLSFKQQQNSSRMRAMMNSKKKISAMPYCFTPKESK